MRDVLTKVLAPVFAGLSAAALAWFLNWIGVEMDGARFGEIVDAATVAVTALLLGVIGYSVPEPASKLRAYLARRQATEARNGDVRG